MKTHCNRLQNVYELVIRSTGEIVKENFLSRCVFKKPLFYVNMQYMNSVKKETCGNIKNEWDNSIPSCEDFEKIAEVLKQLSDPVRMKLFYILCHREECVLDISTLMGMSSPAVSHHLRQLRLSGLITSRREKKEVYYKASENRETSFLHHMIEDLLDIKCPAKN